MHFYTQNMKNYTILNKQARVFITIQPYQFRFIKATKLKNTVMLKLSFEKSINISRLLLGTHIKLTSF